MTKSNTTLDNNVTTSSVPAAPATVPAQVPTVKVQDLYTLSLAGMSSLNVAIATLDSDSEVARTSKASCNQLARAWFESVTDHFAAKHKDDWWSVAKGEIPNLLTTSAQAMREAGDFGSEEAKIKKRDGSEGTKTVATHNHERLLRFFTRVWKATYSNDYGVELKGSTILRWEESTPKVKKTWKDSFKESLENGGMFSANVDKVFKYAFALLAEQDRASETLRDIALDMKKKADKAHQDSLNKAAAEAMALATGKSVDECLKMIVK